MKLFSTHQTIFRRSKKATALVFFTLIFSVFLGFTMLVMNTGRLIYQKMRLQSAVDLAAYAGASVQASYLGNQSSGAESVKGVNAKIQDRYFQLLEDLQNVSFAPFPGVFPGAAGLPACIAACTAMNFVNANAVYSEYENGVRDIQQLHQEIRRILEEMPDATREAVEATLAINIPELAIDGGSGISFDVDVTRDPLEVMGESDSIFEERRNAVLSFSSEKSMYLSNVVGPVPHSFPFYGPACYNAYPEPDLNDLWFCPVNGIGNNSVAGLGAAMAEAVAASVGGGAHLLNIGRLGPISDPDSTAIQIHFIEDVRKPKPFVIAAAEWYPETGNSANLEGDSLFPKRTRLVAVSGAEPFGASLFSNSATPFGTRLQGIRRLLLDPRVQPLKEDYGALFDYMEFLGPKDERGESLETAEDTIRRFLH